MYRIVIGIGMLLAVAQTVHSEVLTEELALKIGLDRDLVQQRISANINQAKSGIVAANTWPNPEISYERETLDGIDAVGQKIVISQEFDFSGRRGLHQQAADLHMEAAKYESEAWRSEMERNIRIRYFDALYQHNRYAAHKATKQRIDLIVSALEKRRKAGDVSLYDYQRIITERAAIAAGLNNAEADFNAAWIYLWALLGGETDKFKTPSSELLPPPPLPLEQADQYLDKQPTLRHLKVKSQAFTAQQDAEQRTFPDVTLGLGWKRDEIAGASDDGLIINASIPLPLFDNRKASQFKYQSQAMTANSEYQLAYDSARSELKGLWQQSMQYRDSAMQYRNESVHTAGDLIKIAETYYRAGEVGIIELLDAYRSAHNAELTALDFEYKARISRIKLDYLTGGPVQ